MAYVDEALISCVSLLVALILKLDWHAMSSLSRTGKCSDATCDSVVLVLSQQKFCLRIMLVTQLFWWQGWDHAPPPLHFYCKSGQNLTLTLAARSKRRLLELWDLDRDSESKGSRDLYYCLAFHHGHFDSLNFGRGRATFLWSFLNPCKLLANAMH